MSISKRDDYEKAALKLVCPTCHAPRSAWCTHGFWSMTKPPAAHLHQPRITRGKRAPKQGVR